MACFLNYTKVQVCWPAFGRKRQCPGSPRCPRDSTLPPSSQTSAIICATTYISIAGKMLAGVIPNHLVGYDKMDKMYNIWPNCSSTNMAFTVRQIQNRCIEQWMELYSVFINLTKAFGMVNHEALWVVLGKPGSSRSFIFPLYYLRVVFSSDGPLAPFSISNSINQGYILASNIFNLFFACILNHALKDLDNDVHINYRWP